MKQYAISDITIVAEGLDHPECVALHPDGSLWAGGEAGQIYRIGKNGMAETVVNTGGFTLGIAFSPQGWLAICDLKNKCVWRYDLVSHALSVWSTGTAERSFHTPNFPVFDNAGNLYVSDSGQFRKDNGCIFRVDPQGNTTCWHKGPFRFCNGMALSASQQTLYVVSTWLPGVETITIAGNGNPGVRQTLVQIPRTCPDGIALDEAGNIFISCYAPNAIYCFTPEGNLLTVIDDWESHTICNPTNIAFGGDDRKELFIANLGRWHISKIKMEIAGLRLSGQ